MEDPETNVSDSTAENIEELDHDTYTSENQKKRGRPRNILWNNHFNEINNKGDGHRGWKCLYCNEQNPRASDINMNTHLALNCKKVPLNIKQELLRKFPVPNQKRKTERDIITGVQPRIDSKFQAINKIDSGQEELCHKSLTRLFVCCGIPFWIVEHPFFLDFCKNLCISYKPPDRKTLSNDWLNSETARITVAMEKELQNENNLTL
ncbi:26902_t:CDS:1, partial [Racocetra persica]